MSLAEPAGRRTDGRSTDDARDAARRAGKPVPYNFRRPDKFSKDHLRSIQTIQEAFGRYAANFLASKVRAAVHMELEAIEQTTVAEYLDELEEPSILFVSPLEPLVGRAIIQVDIDLAFLVVDRMLGGSGDPMGLIRSTASLTEIEMLLLEDVGKGLLAEFSSAWEQVTPLRPTSIEVALSAMQVQGLLPSEVALVIRHDIMTSDFTGRLSICLPASMLEPLLPRLNARLLFATRRAVAGDNIARQLSAQMENVPLRLHVELGRVSIRVADLLDIEVGDVIRLDTSANHALPVVIEDRACFLAHPGQQAGQLAARIVERLDDTDDHAE